ncbi:hypothetical protein QBC33DRAFT_559353 [Phialemonium atrogriseum]|uniref:Uncharacterized protein n=1 Tax=Phialemonium atrogriseum TaxID=1093897 RepID=A0AAJ0C1Z3_9PEZI|nr:uncharacterized protein QBC33DRAFT_559353 [Phialemonium atrogriseum]KAK1767227.1 hypothetical protein QBC33DRAFT_559353 [Phialemonium atrogriseum]
MGEPRHALAELRNVSNTATRLPRRNRDNTFWSASHDADDKENQGQQKKPQASSSSLRQETDPKNIRLLWAQVAAYNALPWTCTSAASLTCPSSVSTANIAPAAAVSDFRALLGTYCNAEIVQKPLAWTPESYFEQEKLGGDAGDSAERGTTRDEESLRCVLGTAYISLDEAKAFAAEHRTIVTVWAGGDDMVKANYLGRLLLRGHVLNGLNCSSSASSPRRRTLFIEPPRARGVGEDPFPGWQGCTVRNVATIGCTGEKPLARLADWLDAINRWGLETFAVEVQEDLDLCLKAEYGAI